MSNINSNAIFFSICEKLDSFFRKYYPITSVTPFRLTKYGNAYKNGVVADEGFAWIGQARHEIGTQPVHYELRMSSRGEISESSESYLFVEVHVESEQVNSRMVQIIKTELNKLAVRKKLKRKNSSNNYHWYRRPGVYFPLNDDNCNIKSIADEFIELDRLVGPDIMNIIENKI